MGEGGANDEDKRDARHPEAATDSMDETHDRFLRIADHDRPPLSDRAHSAPEGFSRRTAIVPAV